MAEERRGEVERPRVMALSMSRSHEFSKKNVERVMLLEGLGVEGDCHSGPDVQHLSRRKGTPPYPPNLRQIHLVHAELFDSVSPPPPPSPPPSLLQKLLVLLFHPSMLTLLPVASLFVFRHVLDECRVGGSAEQRLGKTPATIATHETAFFPGWKKLRGLAVGAVLVGIWVWGGRYWRTGLTSVGSEEWGQPKSGAPLVGSPINTFAMAVLGYVLFWLYASTPVESIRGFGDDSACVAAVTAESEWLVRWVFVEWVVVFAGVWGWSHLRGKRGKGGRTGGEAERKVNGGYVVRAGDLGENITTRGIDLLGLGEGTELLFTSPPCKPADEVDDSISGDEPNDGGDDTELPRIRITGLRNPCPQIDNFAGGLKERFLVRDAEGAILERKAGVMAVVVRGGEVRVGDEIVVVLPEGGHKKLIAV